MNVLFWFRKSEARNQIASDNPTGSIMCRITIAHHSVELGSTKIKCKKSEWCADRQSFSNAGSKNSKSLHDISGRLSRIYDILLTKYDFVSPVLVKEHFLSNKKFTYTMEEITTAFLGFRGSLVTQGSITKTTLEVNDNYVRHILNFCKQKNIIRPIETPQTFLYDFYDYLMTNCMLGSRYARKVVAFSKQVFKWATRKKMSPKMMAFEEDIPGRADSEDYLDTTHLSVAQLTNLINFDFNSLVLSGQLTPQSAETLEAERDAFAFNCFTGMHHCDYSSLDFSIENYRDNLFLKGCRKKTKKPFTIKLLEPAVAILKKYNNSLTELPIKSNQKRNGTLKQIAVLTKLNIVLTTKIARKTFCDLAINELLMSPDDVAACLGLTSTRYLKNYGRIREKRLLKVMKSWESLLNAS